VDADCAESPERRNEHSDDARAEEAGAAMIEGVERSIPEVTEDLPEDQRDQQENESERGDPQEYVKRGYV
jgi:hypothetical protein